MYFAVCYLNFTSSHTGFQLARQFHKALFFLSYKVKELNTLSQTIFMLP